MSYGGGSMGVNLVMLGPPGAGKGTQAERLAAAWGVPKISTGDILRDAVASGSELGRIAKQTMEAGRLVSDEVMVGVVRERLDRPDAARGFVLDGFPRTVAQADALDGVMGDRGPLIVLDLAVPVEQLVRRLSARRVCAQCGATVSAADADASASCGRCGGRLVQRRDDEEGVVRERLRVYARDTQPLVEHYRSRPTFRSIDGDRPPAEVAESLRSAVESLAGAET